MAFQKLPVPSEVFYKKVRIPISQLKNTSIIKNGRSVPAYPNLKKPVYQYLVYSKYPVGFHDDDFGTFKANTPILETNARTKKEAIEMKKWVMQKYKGRGVVRNIRLFRRRK